MSASWLIWLLVIGAALVDLVLVLALVALGALFTGFVAVKAFQDYIEKIVFELIKDLLAELQRFIGKKEGKLAGATGSAVTAANALYGFVLGVYNFAQSALFALIAVGVGLLAVAISVSLVAISGVLVYLVFTYLI